MPPFLPQTLQNGKYTMYFLPQTLRDEKYTMYFLPQTLRDEKYTMYSKKNPLQGADLFAAFVREQNAAIDKYARIVSQRK
jgi:hypothetical protein